MDRTRGITIQTNSQRPLHMKAHTVYRRPEHTWNAEPTAEDWTHRLRQAVLRSLLTNTVSLTWNKRLIALVLEELWIDDLFIDLMGEPRRLAKRRYPQAVAMAMLIRYSWRPDTLAYVVKQLGLKSTVSGPKHPKAAGKRAKRRAVSR